MNTKKTVSGIIIILLSIWMYSAASSFKVEEGSSPERLVIREGALRTEDEVAKKLAEEMHFDLEGAYKTGYTPRNVIEYLIGEPHEYDVTFYDNRFYEGRMTLLRMIPTIICAFLAILGIGIIMPKKDLKRSRAPRSGS